ncbi:MAG: tetratricopeptide repeat protein [Rhodanobacteraceae bacterium]
MGATGFIAELRRRNVLRAAALYAAAIWLLVQIALAIFPVFDLHANWMVRWIIIAALAGFPFALAFAWLYELTPEGLKLERDVAPHESNARLTGRRLDFAIIGVLAVVVLLLTTERFVARDSVAIPEKSVAVLPLVNESGDARQDYFSDGLSEELISALAQVRDLKVIGRNSSFRFRGAQQGDSSGIGSRLGVATLLEGTVRKQGDKVRIVASLIKASDGSQLWSQTYDRELKDVFAVQSAIANSVADALQATLLGVDSDALKPDAPPNGSVEAYNALLQGNFYDQRHTAGDLRKAAGFYEHAVALDPTYAYAWARLSLTRTTLVSNFPESLSRDEQTSIAAAAIDAATAALKLEPENSEAHLARGAVLENLDLEPLMAEAEYRRAAQLSPHNPDTMRKLAALQAELGHFEAAVEGYRQAVALDPLAARAWNDMAISLVALKRYAEAEAAERTAIQLRPQGGFQHAWLAVTQMLAGDTVAAPATARLEPDPLWRNWALALTAWANGDRTLSDASLDRLIASDADDAGSQIADIYAQRGEFDEMFRWLEHAYATHDGGAVEIYTSPFVTTYRDDPRFADFARKVGVMPPAPTSGRVRP